MSNQAYDKLHKLVRFLIKENKLTATEVCFILEIPWEEFVEEFGDEVKV